jgi:mRNA interferase RelE/StbE
MGKNQRRDVTVDIKFIPEAEKDYKSLDGSIKKLVNDKIDDLRDKPYMGEELGNKNNIDLTGFYKIYVAKKKYRIVYRIVKDEIEIIEIWGIGKRDKLEVYEDVGKRIKKRQ